MITKRAMEEAQMRGAQRALALYGLDKAASAATAVAGAAAKGAKNMGLFGTLSQGAQRFNKAFTASKQSLPGAISTGWKAMGAPAQNVVKGIGAAGVGAYALGNVRGQNQGMEDAIHAGRYR